MQSDCMMLCQEIFCHTDRIRLAKETILKVVRGRYNHRQLNPSRLWFML